MPDESLAQEPKPILEVARGEQLVLYDSSNVSSDLSRDLYPLKDYAQLAELRGRISRHSRELEALMEVLELGNVRTVEEVAANLRQAQDVLRDKQRFMNDRARGAARRQSTARDASGEKALFDDYCWLWKEVVRKAGGSVIRPTALYAALGQLMIYFEDNLRLKDNKPVHDDSARFVGRARADLRTDEKLLGIALGKALEGTPAAIATCDGDFLYMFPVYCGMLFSPDVGGDGLGRALRERPVRLYHARKDEDYVLRHTTETIQPCTQFVVYKLPQARSEEVKAGVRARVQEIQGLLAAG